ncbi:unnamed protein product [Strongylus vulgaris]|uniref:Uncharacterized protein n=1 Tax=Strongylus vulgaris TaxID=40348 RepID=A0A3P7L682_STRVU|nr:unnamed protein product [Strongylus vulgaris]
MDDMDEVLSNYLVDTLIQTEKKTLKRKSESWQKLTPSLTKKVLKDPVEQFRKDYANAEPYESDMTLYMLATGKIMSMTLKEIEKEEGEVISSSDDDKKAAKAKKEEKRRLQYPIEIKPPQDFVKRPKKRSLKDLHFEEKKALKCSEKTKCVKNSEEKQLARDNQNRKPRKNAEDKGSKKQREEKSSPKHPEGRKYSKPVQEKQSRRPRSAPQKDERIITSRGAIYSAYRSYFDSNSPSAFGVRTVEEAVESLNANVNALEALRFIQLAKPDDSFVCSLSPTALGVLALRGSDLCQHVPVTKYTFDEDDVAFPTLLAKLLRKSDFNIIVLLITFIKFDLGATWENGIAWLNRVACPEEDLACSEGWFMYRPSQIFRLSQLIRLLFLRTEIAFDPAEIGVEVVPFLYLLYTRFRDTNKEISILALKTLSNVALNGSAYAVSIFTSEWLPLLASMVVHGKTLQERLISHKICQNALSSLGAIDYQLRSDIYELFLPEKEPVVDVVMIHGLRGGVAYTWRQKDHSSNIVSNCWPKACH